MYEAMTDKRVVVPEEMLEAAMESRKQIAGQVGGWSDGMCRQVLEAALLYQREHPPVPTHAEMWEISKAIDDSDMNWPTFWIALIKAWIERMYAPAEPELGKAARRVIDDMMGCTFTPQEADAIVDVLQRNAHGWDARGLRERS